MRSRRSVTRRAASAQVPTVAAGTPGVVAVAIQVEGVEAAGREAGWDVEAWAAGEDKPIAAEAT
jgi:hypothetical protein